MAAPLYQGGDIGNQRQKLPLLSLGSILDQGGQFGSSTATRQDATNHPTRWMLPALGSTPSHVSLTHFSPRGADCYPWWKGDRQSEIHLGVGILWKLSTVLLLSAQNFLSSHPCVLASPCTQGLTLYPLLCYGTCADPLWSPTDKWGRWRQWMNEWKQSILGRLKPK